MMMVETEVRQSQIHGLGVFLKNAVPKGTLLWRFDPRMDRVYTEAEIAALPEHTQDYIRIYSTWHEPTGLYVLCGDNGRYVNHSDAPNTVSAGACFGDDYAAEDLPAGAEWTSDYRLICDRVRLDGMEFTPPAVGLFAGLVGAANLNGGTRHQAR